MSAHEHEPGPVTLTELLAARRGTAGGYVTPGPDGDQRLGFMELFDRSGAAAGVLARSSPRPRAGAQDARVVLAVAEPLAFIVAFFAAIRAGLVPVPVPGRATAHPARRRRLLEVVETVSPTLIVTDGIQVSGVRPLLGTDAPQVLATEDLFDALADAETGQPAEDAPQVGDPDAAAYIQCTSGSTGVPKAITLQHGQVLAQLRQAATAYDEDPASVSVNWVPLHHDMGLVTSVLRPLWSGYTAVLLDPVEFVRRPALWPEQMSRWAATHTSAPDFGYALCAQKTEGCDGLDLSTLRVARSAGELVKARTLRAFTEAFVPAGFAAAAFCPSYGLAEATLTVTTCPVSEPPRTVWVSRSALRADQIEPPRDEGDALELVSCGRPLDRTVVSILDADGTAFTADDRLGEIWIAGPQVTPGDAEAEATGDGVRREGLVGRRTGDLGFLHEGELVLIGRSADRFQVRGVNYSNTEIEDVAAQADPRLRAGRVAAFLAGDPDGDSPSPVVLAETRRGADLDAAEISKLTEAITRAVSREAGLGLDRVLVVPAGTLPVTTSGKLRRNECRLMYEANSLPGQTKSWTENEDSPWIQPGTQAPSSSDSSWPATAVRHPSGS